MAQGAIKKSKSKSGSGGGAASSSSKKHKSTALAPRPGKRVIAPKKAELVRQDKLKKKVTSGLIAATERTLAAKAGHLELLRGGKKDRKDRKVQEEARKAAGGK